MSTTRSTTICKTTIHLLSLRFRHIPSIVVQLTATSATAPSFDSIVNTYLITHCNLHPPTSPQIGLVVHSHCDYFGPVAFPAVLDVGMRVKKLGKSSVTYETAVFEQGIEEVRAVGEFVHVYVESESRRPAPEGMTKGMREALAALVEKQAKL